MASEATVLVELGVLLLLLGGAGALAWRVGISAVPLFLLAGLLVGEGGLLPAEAVGPFLSVAAEIGVVLLLLTLGMEFSGREFVAALRQHAPSGLVDFALNATPGFVAGWLLGLPVAGCVALAGITWVSSSGIVARTLVDLRRLGNRETPAVLSVLVLEDVAMAAYLPLLGALLAGAAIWTGATTAVLAVGAVVGVIVASARIGPRLERLVLHDSDEQVLLRVLGVTLVVAGVAEAAGISAAVGAFLVGLALPARSGQVAGRVLSPLRDLFAAAFFLSFGYETDTREIPSVLPTALALGLVTGLTKVATGWVAAARDGVAAPGRLRAGTVLVARGEFSIVIAGLAVAAGVGELGSVAATYVLVMAIACPLLTRAVDQRQDAPRVAR
jgi:CPA2 family monovalent cation:H+ antiporter-2